jgi:hypothetical protein
LLRTPTRVIGSHTRWVQPSCLQLPAARSKCTGSPNKAPGLPDAELKSARYSPWKVVTATVAKLAPIASFSTVESSTCSVRTLSAAPPWAAVL